MKNTVGEILRSFIPKIIVNHLKKLHNEKMFKQWKKNNYLKSPPHIVKEIIIGKYQQKYSYTTFIETGTYRGDMVEAQKTRFKKIISIELSEYLYKKAKRRFSKNRNVNIVLGDSSKVLPKILEDIHESVIFWLDAHYTGGITERGNKICPILEELEAILNSRTFNHIILIDDANFFGGMKDFPTINELIKIIKNKNVRCKVEVKYDIIAIFVNSDKTESRINDVSPNKELELY